MLDCKPHAVKRYGNWQAIVIEILDFYLKFYIFEIRLNLNCEEKIKTSFSVFVVYTNLSDWISTIWIGVCQP
jgi:hypothetical protein